MERGKEIETIYVKDEKYHSLYLVEFLEGTLGGYGRDNLLYI